jgi:predicted metalloprotease
MRAALASVVALVVVLALGVLAGCGDDSNSSAGTQVTVNEPAAVEVDAADPEATKTPQGAEVLDQFAELRAAQGEPSVPAIRGSAGLSTTDWIHTVDGDVATYWQKQFNGSGYKYSPAKELIFDKTLKSGCGVKANVRTGPFYCTADESIYFPLTFFQKYPEKFGDAATAVVVAHENAHRVQDLLGLFGAPGIVSAQLELQADCLAGVWAKTVYARGLLEEGDIGEILGLVNVSGDSPETPIKAPGAHGSSALRQDFFAQGYDGGKPGSCPVPKKSSLNQNA